MCLTLLGGIEMIEQMDTHETEKDMEKKRKLEEVNEGKKMTKPNDDMTYLKRDILAALQRSDEKNGKLLKKDSSDKSLCLLLT